jgi:hypothetical protein
MLRRRFTAPDSMTPSACPRYRLPELVCPSNGLGPSIGSTFPVTSVRKGKCTIIFWLQTIILFQLRSRWLKARQRGLFDERDKCRPFVICRGFDTPRMAAGFHFQALTNGGRVAAHPELSPPAGTDGADSMTPVIETEVLSNVSLTATAGT